MPRIQTLPETGSLVTVTITDETGTVHEFHGTLLEQTGMVMHESADALKRVRYSHHRVPLLAGEMWVRIYSATGDPFSYGHLAVTGREWSLSMYEFYVSTEAENVTIAPITPAGRLWVDANLSLDNQRARLVEQIKALDPKLGEAADDLFGKVEHDAFARGKDQEWHVHND